jgi:predicted lipoprotein
MSTPIKTIIAVAAGLLLVYLSLDIRKLDSAKNKPEGFDLASYTRVLWERDLPEIARQGADIRSLLSGLTDDPVNTCRTRGHKLGISQTVYFFARGTGTITSLDDENVIVTLGDGRQVKIATDFIFGNAVREASGLVNIDDFLNMTDFNNVSVDLNKRVKENVARPLRNAAAPGMSIEFTGAFEVNEKKPEPNGIRIIPVMAEVKPAPHE